MDSCYGVLLLRNICLLTILFGVGLGSVNVAQNKPTNQSGAWGDLTSEKAVDGVTDSDGDKSCIHTWATGNDAIAWWRVDLKMKLDISEVVIFNRDSFRERLSDSWVLVSNDTKPNANYTTICNEITRVGQFSELRVSVECNYGSRGNGGYIRGRYVTIQRQQLATPKKHILNFCEVQVMSCENGTWGSNCSQLCSANCVNRTCATSDGYCYNGCDIGFYGRNCVLDCHCKNKEACRRDNGQCPGKCHEDYTGETCSIKRPSISEGPKATYNKNTNQVTLEFKRAENLHGVIITGYLIEVQSEQGGSWAHFTQFGVPMREVNGNILGTPPIDASRLGPKTNFRVIPLYKHDNEDNEEKGKTSSESGFIPTRKDGSAVNIGLIAGIAVAVLVLIILVIVVIVLLVRYRKQGKNDKKKLMLPSSKPMTSDYTYENPIAIKPDNVDALKSVKVDKSYDIPVRSPIVNGIVKHSSGSQTPELLPSEDEDGQIYDNPMIIPPIKVSELSSYIEKRKGEADAFKREYQQLPAGDKAKWEVGNKAENRNKNRFVNIRAYDHSRVVLSIVDGDIHSDYINADFITGYKDKPKVYVAAQGPKKCTLIDTWRMMWELNANRIVMVTNLVEGGKLKCEKYWPDTEETYGEYKVLTTSNEVFADYSLKQFELTYKDETRTVYHFHFTSWPDHGVPITATALLNFRRKVRSFDNLGTGPMVVHCSAGVGRTGTFIALDTLLEQARVEDEVDVYKYACVMRSNRVNMIQTLEQYIFVYDGLLEALMSGDTSIPCPELASRYEEMKNINPETNKSKLQDQFDVLEVLKPAKREEKLTALEPQNKDKNRDVEIVPSNRFRPFLSIKVEGCTDYINAVYIDGYKMRLAYIITQSPLPNTITDMWRLAYDHASRTIVMLNQLSDGDDDCPVYWPKDKETPLEFEPLTVSLVDEKVDSVTPSITVRDFSIVHSSKPNNPVMVKQFHLTNWAEGESLPESKDDILDVMELVERWQQQSGNGPVTIHCRNGCDKSGLYCAASYTVEKLKLDREVDVFHAVKHVRVCRPAVVPTMEQYMYLHELALEYIDKFEIYANFK